MNIYKTIDAFMLDLSPEKKQQVLLLRSYIQAAVPALEEHIKWNAPSYVSNSEDRITFNVINKEGLVKLVFHMGATRKEDRKAEPVLKDASLIEWISDIRGYATFNNLDEIISHENSIKDTVRRWVELV